MFLFIGSAIPAAAELMTLTLVRHGQSFGNLPGAPIDTATPGPTLTDLGLTQAAALADPGSPTYLGANDYDGVYASSMIRTQYTATPLANHLGEAIIVLPGLREIEAGDFEGTQDAAGYISPMIEWAAGDLNERIPGSINGQQFDNRFDKAVRTIYKSGDRNAVAFAHGASIASWVMINVENPPANLFDVLLPNAGYVVVVGSPQDGWTLVNVNGIPVAPNPLETSAASATSQTSAVSATSVVSETVTEPKTGPAAVVSDVLAQTKAPVAVKTDREPKSAPVAVSVAHGAPVQSATSTAAETTATTKAPKKAAVSNGATGLTSGKKATPGTAGPAAGQTTTDEASRNGKADASVAKAGADASAESGGSTS
jgi:broad specificity phosphatase PhoE